MSCGVPATPTGRAIARQKAAQIEKDLLNDYFDPTLLKYTEDPGQDCHRDKLC